MGIMLLSLTAFNISWAGSYDSTNLSAEGRKWQPAPTGYGTPGKDNGRGIGTHNTGEDCGICHTPGGKAPNSVFTMSGTLYMDRAARKPLKGGEVILQDVNGKVISMTSNEVGNFWTYEPIGSNPYAVVGYGNSVQRLYTTDASGFHPAPATDSRSWQYKTWVKNGDQELPMVTIAPVGGTGSPRMGCSMHHGPMGSYGALYVSTKSTLPSYPASGLSFKKHILPIFRNQCAPCHVPTLPLNTLSGTSLTRVVTKSDIDTPTNTRVDYSGNINLTSYGAADGTNGTKKGVKSLVNTSTPDASKLFSATVKGSQHSGGWFWTETEPDYKAIKQWIAEGAQNN